MPDELIYESLPALYRFVQIGNECYSSKLGRDDVTRSRLLFLDNNHWLKIQKRGNRKKIFRGSRLEEFFQLSNLLSEQEPSFLISYYDRFYPDRIKVSDHLAFLKTTFEQFLGKISYHSARLVRLALLSAETKSLQIKISSSTGFENSVTVFSAMIQLRKKRVSEVLHQLLNPLDRSELWQILKSNSFYQASKRSRFNDLLIVLRTDGLIVNDENNKFSITKKGLTALILFQALKCLQENQLIQILDQKTPLGNLLDTINQILQLFDPNKIDENQFNMKISDAFRQLVLEASFQLKE